MKKILLVVSASLPFIMGCNKVNVLDEANNILKENKDKINTCYDAVSFKGVTESLMKIKLSSKQEYVYDSLNKQFVIMEEDKIVASPKDYTPSDNTLDYFKFVTTYNPNSKYSQYLLESADSLDQLLITTGFDAGTHKDIKNVAYANESRDGKKVLIRCYCDYLSILAPTQTITHYEDATNVIITDCSQYNEHGESAYVKAKKGNVYISNDSTCALDMFEKVKGCEDDVNLSYEDNSKVYGLINCKDEEIKGTAYKLIEKEIKTGKEFKEYVTKEQKEKFLRLGSDILLDEKDQESIVVDHAICIDLNGFRLEFSNFAVSKSSQIKEAMRIQSKNDGKDRNVYIIDSQGVLDEHSGISLNDCSIVVAGANELKEGKVVSSNLVLNSGKITQTITTKEDNPTVGGAITILGKTKTEHCDKEANFIMYGGKVSCNNLTGELNKYGCIGAVGSGAHVNLEFGVLTSNDFCIYGKEPGDGWDLSGAKVDIYGGTLTSSNNACIYFPSTANINIEGGKINGESCITATSGSINISNSTKLVASGSGAKYTDSCYDGSAIYVIKHKFDYKELNIKVKDSTLTSKHEYISNVKYKEGTTTNKTIFSFESGTYNYKMGDGLLFGNNDYVTVNSREGTWNKSSY